MNALWHRFLRFGFYLLYNQLAWTYDLVSWCVSLGQWRAWTRAGIPFLIRDPHTPTTVLEIAHGPGHMLIELHQQGYQVTGIDLSPYMGKQARRRLQQKNIHLPLIQGDVGQLPFATASFHHLLSTFPTDFIFDPANLAQFYRVLRPKGRLVIVPQAQLTDAGILTRFIEWLYWITGQRSHLISANKTPSPQETLLWQRLQQVGFTPEIVPITQPHSLVYVVIAHKIA